MSDKMREALEWLADEMRSELTDDGASLPQWLVKSWLSRCNEALAEQPAQGEAVAWYDGKKFYGSEEAAVCDCADMPNLRAVYYAPPAPAVLDDVAKDAARFRWLTDDHADPETRVVVRKLLVSMKTRSLSGARIDIDAAIAAALLAAAPEVKPWLTR